MNKVIVISGGTDGLGKATAQTLSKENQVIILSPTEKKLKQVSQETNCDYEKCDVSNYKAVKTAINNILKKHKRIDVLINNAALWIQGELDDNEPEHIKKVVEVNTLGAIYLEKSVIPIMKKQKDGLIINVISQAGWYGKSERSVYTATKFALTGFTKSLQPELAKYGIRVTGFYPGKMNTKMFEKMGINKDMKNALDVNSAAKTIEYIINAENELVFPEVGLKHISN